MGGLGVSYTEMEIDTAARVGIPRIVVLLRDPPADGRGGSTPTGNVSTSYAIA